MIIVDKMPINLLVSFHMYIEIHVLSSLLFAISIVYEFTISIPKHVILNSLSVSVLLAYI